MADRAKGMRALLKEGGSVRLARVPEPVIAAGDDVLVRVAFAGVCRTDLLVAEGRLPSRDPIVLGHELSGVVAAAGPSARGIAAGDRVTVAPLLACGRCRGCLVSQANEGAGRGAACSAPEMLGVLRHGAFADMLVVPAASVHRIPAGLPMRTAAYVEPVAASLAVLHAGISREQRGLVLGRGRIAELTMRVLLAHGFERVDLRAPGDPLAEDEYDFAIETAASTAVMRALAAAVRPRGRVVLKSRLVEPVALDLLQIVPKELTLAAAHYGSFEDAIALLASRRLVADDLLGPARPLEAFADVLEDAKKSEQNKLFFAISPEA